MNFANVPIAVLAGGLATRLGVITTGIPKSLVEVAGRPFVDHQLALLRRNGLRRVVFCIGHLGHLIEQHVGNGSALGMEIAFSHDGGALRGTGGALRHALPLLGDTFWVLYGDSYLDIDYVQIWQAFQNHDVLGMMTVLRNDNRWDKSNVQFKDGKLLDYSKTNTSVEMTHIDYGLTLLQRSAAERLPHAGKSDLADLYSTLVAERQMAGFEVTRRFYEIGSPRGLLDTEEYLKKRAG
jgi:NDP-sugar pyrophosphorylase family protein